MITSSFIFRRAMFSREVVTIFAHSSSHREHLYLQWGQNLPVQHQTESCGEHDSSKSLAKMLVRLNELLWDLSLGNL